MSKPQLEHGSYYTLRDHEDTVFVAMFRNGNWFLIKKSNNTFAPVLIVQDNRLFVGTIDGRVGSPTLWTLDDVLLDSPELALLAERQAQIDAIARDLLADVDI